ncbi:hypothetical protein JCM16303_000649 [Sporobolomyces ruberrimus]
MSDNHSLSSDAAFEKALVLLDHFAPSLPARVNLGRYLSQRDLFGSRDTQVLTNAFRAASRQVQNFSYDASDFGYAGRVAKSPIFTTSAYHVIALLQDWWRKRESTLDADGIATYLVGVNQGSYWNDPIPRLPPSEAKADLEQKKFIGVVQGIRATKTGNARIVPLELYSLVKDAKPKFTFVDQRSGERSTFFGRVAQDVQVFRAWLVPTLQRGFIVDVQAPPCLSYRLNPRHATGLYEHFKEMPAHLQIKVAETVISKFLDDPRGFVMHEILDLLLRLGLTSSYSTHRQPDVDPLGRWFNVGPSSSPTDKRAKKCHRTVQADPFEVLGSDLRGTVSGYTGCISFALNAEGARIALDLLRRGVTYTKPSPCDALASHPVYQLAETIQQDPQFYHNVVHLSEEEIAAIDSRKKYDAFVAKKRERHREQASKNSPGSKGSCSNSCCSANEDLKIPFSLPSEFYDSPYDPAKMFCLHCATVAAVCKADGISEQDCLIAMAFSVHTVKPNGHQSWDTIYHLSHKYNQFFRCAGGCENRYLSAIGTDPFDGALTSFSLFSVCDNVCRYRTTQPGERGKKWWVVDRGEQEAEYKAVAVTLESRLLRRPTILEVRRAMQPIPHPPMHQARTVCCSQCKAYVPLRTASVHGVGIVIGRYNKDNQPVCYGCSGGLRSIRSMTAAEVRFVIQELSQVEDGLIFKLNSISRKFELDAVQVVKQLADRSRMSAVANVATIRQLNQFLEALAQQVD